MSTTDRRSPLPPQLPKVRKARSGRTTASETPLSIRASGVPMDDETEARVRRKLGLRLGKFARLIERVALRFTDVNGPKGGVDKTCRIQVVLSGLPTVVVEERSKDIISALDAAGHVAERATKRAIEKSGHSQGRVPKSARPAPVAAEPKPKKPRVKKAKAKAPRATAVLEDSGDARPSRKSGRRSANRVLSGNLLTTRATAKARAPSARTRQGR